MRGLFVNLLLRGPWKCRNNSTDTSLHSLWVNKVKKNKQTIKKTVKSHFVGPFLQLTGTETFKKMKKGKT